ncbi:BHE40 protein, partial [Penelope pileata]|nr:BHE40 protein [Penelope pileata]
MERIPSAQPPPVCLGKLQPLESGDVPGLDFAHMYQVYKPRRGLKRSEDNKETYKLPHRLIEKKRRDRINECIAQLKDLLPEHLKLTTLGHLEKAVVLELTLKHVKALTTLIEQQQQKIVALQSGLQAGEHRGQRCGGKGNLDASQEMFRSGFQLCAKELLQYVAKHDNKELKAAQLVGHLHRLAAELLPGPPTDPKEKAAGPGRGGEGHGKNCVPVIQRTFAACSGEQSGSDTDTDSGYGGELEKGDPKAEQPYLPKESPELKYAVQERIGCIKQESEDPPAKRSRLEVPDEDGPFGSEVLGTAGGFLPPHAHQPPLCLPFYLIPPFVGPDKLPPPLLLPQRLPSPGPARSPIDSSALLQALKQIPPLNLETKD